MPINPTTKVKKTAIFRHLKSLNNDLSKQCLNFINHVTPFLRSIKAHFPYYTRHDDIHSLHILVRLQEILSPNCMKKGNSLSFNATESFLLICAAFGHDLGMTLLPGEEIAILSNLGIERSANWKTNPSLQEYLRKTHSERGGQYIARHIGEIGIPLSQWHHLDLLMRSHNLSIAALYSQLGRRFSSESREIDLLQLASIFCIADLIEYSEDRVHNGVIDQLRETLERETDKALLVSLQENLKHNGIGANLGIGPDGQIIMSGTFTDPDVLNTAYHAVDLIQGWIREYGDIDYRSGRKRLRIRTDSVATTFDIPGKEFNRLGIRMNKQNVIGLISSNAVWNHRPEIVIRELLQNAVEACRYRAFTTRSQQYEPEIRVEFNQQERTVTISDNGCGMSPSTILNNFLTVGNSRSKDDGYVLPGYFSLARFGIGFWSTFTIAEKAVIKTSEYIDSDESQDGISFEVSINSLKEYTIFGKKAMRPGTRITLHLKPSIIVNSLANRIFGRFGVIQCSPIPIIISLGEMQTIVPGSPVIPTLQELFGPKVQYASKEGINLFRYPSLLDQITIEVYIIARKNDGLVSFHYSDGSRVMIVPSIPAISSICGFTINMLEYLPVYQIIPDMVGYVANINNPEGFMFDITRASLLPSEAYEEFTRNIALQQISAYRKFLQDNNCYNTPDIIRLLEEGSTTSRAGMLKNKEVLSILLSVAPDLLCYKLFKVDPQCSIHNCTVEFLTYNEMKERRYRILTITRMYSIHNPGTGPTSMKPFFMSLLKCFMTLSYRHTLLADVNQIFFSTMTPTTTLFRFHSQYLEINPFMPPYS